MMLMNQEVKVTCTDLTGFPFIELGRKSSQFARQFAFMGFTSQLIEFLLDVFGILIHAISSTSTNFEHGV
jgi:hypothetical protein